MIHTSLTETEPGTFVATTLSGMPRNVQFTATSFDHATNAVQDLLRSIESQGVTEPIHLSAQLSDISFTSHFVFDSGSYDECEPDDERLLENLGEHPEN